MGDRAFLVLLGIFSVSAAAQTPMTVADAESVVFGKGNKEANAARVRGVELTERLSAARLAHWLSSISDQKTRATLPVIADLSAFLPLPAADIPSGPPPDQPTQLEILNRATAYAANMRPRLPNFSALRTTTRFEIASPEDLEEEERSLQFQQMSRATLAHTSLGSVGRDLRLFLMGTSRTLVTYRDGVEVRTPEPDPHQYVHLSDPGLVSSGEFGSILAVVDRDAAASTIAWDHWELGPKGLLAVYHYAVPRDKSHFSVYSSSNFPGLGPDEDNPAYHGEIAVDPDDGSIYRIVVQADSDPPDPALVSGVIVEYAPTAIGGKMYVCPVHAIALLTRRDPTANNKPGPLRRFVNDGIFTQYHLFRSDSRIIP